MNKKFVRFYFVFVLLIFIFSITYFISETYRSYKNNSKETQTAFFQLKNDSSDDDLFLKSIEKFSQDSNVIALQIIKNKKGFYAKNENFNYNFESAMISVISDCFNESDNFYEITAAVYKLNPDTIYKNAKFSFLIILTFTIITAVLLIFINQKNNKESKNIFNENSNNSQLNDENIYESDVDSVAETEENSLINLPEEESLSDKEPELCEINKEEELHSYEQENNDLSTQETETVQFTPEESTEKLSIEEDSDENNQTSLLQEILNTKTETAVFLIKTDTDDNFLKTKVLTEKYFDNDIIIEKENNTILIIKKNINIDEAEDCAAEFHEELLSEYEDMEQNSVCIGISCTTTRLITADRLILEAEEALKHAINEKDSDIIGFHVDIDKYNEFIASEENKQ